MTEQTVNTAMQRHWNEVAGPRWVARAGAQEARNIEVAHILLEAAAARPGERVLDVGCGTGATAAPFARAVAPGGTVTGVDISGPMLDQARKNIAAAGLGNVSLILADAQVHCFPANSVDLLISRFGVMFFADPVAAFTNLQAALCDGGRLCMAVWSTIENNTHWKVPFEIAVRHLGPPAPTSLTEPGPMAFRDPGYFGDILEQAGFADIDIQPRRFDVIGGSAAEEAENAAQFGPAWRLMEEKQAPETTRRAIIAEVAAAYAARETPDGLRLPGTILLARARRAG